MAEGFPKLVVVSGPEEGMEISLPSDDVCRIGRADENRLVLQDSSISRHHSVVTVQGGQYYLQDLESRNGTLHEGTRLKPEDFQKLQHLDLIEIGVYELRFLEKPFSQEDLKRKFESQDKKSKQTEPLLDQDQEPSQKQDQEAESLLQDILEDQKQQEEIISKKDEDKKNSRLFLWIGLAILILSVGAGLVYFLMERKPVSLSEDEFEVIEGPAGDLSEKEFDDEEVPAPSKTSYKVIESLGQKTPQTSPSQDVNIFLDVKTKPLPATIYFQEERLGVTPLKKNVRVKLTESYDLYADYELRDINDIYRKKIRFEAKSDADVIELDVQAEIGVLKIMNLPRRTEFYLEGYYEYDQLKARPVKITDIIYGKPIYLPYGKYVVELREYESVSGSQNKISQIKYQREFSINKANPVLEVKVTDGDLGFFPVVIKSNPTNADVFFEGQLLGNTPYEGTLPVGLKTLTLKKEGYFEKTLTVDMRTNSIFETMVELETSKVGELLNNAKEKLRLDQKQEALDILVETLKYGGSEKEKSEVYYNLGNTYFLLQKFDQAIPYFEKASEHGAFRDKAKLGLAKVYHRLENQQKAVALVVEVLAAVTEKTPVAVRSEANSVFKKISPIKSVMYIYSEPGDANVFINDKKISQPTPAILWDLGLGTYRVEIEKPGYESYKTKKNFAVGEFSFVKVRLRKQKF